MELLDEFWQCQLATATANECPALTASLEISTHSERPRVHLHAIATVKRTQDSPRYWPARLKSDFMFRGLPPSHQSPAADGKGTNPRNRAVREGHYYLQCPKLGHVAYRTNWKSCFDFPVDARFIRNLYQVNKISVPKAIEEFVRARDRASAWVQELRRTLALEATAEAERRAAAAQASWSSQPFKPACAAELGFLRQFAWRFQADLAWALTSAAAACEAGSPGEPDPPLRRYRFLIYNGPSRMGKTERACHWFDAAQTLLVNAQNCTTPSLRALHASGWRCIVYDEGNWALAAANRALFQSGPRPVTLSQSNCNESAYDVNVYATPQIICSNHFWQGCSSAEDRLWIEANSFFVEIMEPTWLDALPQPHPGA